MAVLEIVDGHQVVHVDFEVLGDSGQGVAAPDLVGAVPLLGSVALVLVDLRQRRQHLVAGRGSRNAQFKAARYVLGAAPDGWAQGWIVFSQHISIDAEHALQGINTHVVGDAHQLRRWWRVARDGIEVLFRIEVNFHGGQKGNIEVTRRKAETPALVLAHDTRDVLGAQLACRAAHSRSAVIVRGNGERPGAGGGIVVAQQLGRRHRGQIGIHTLVDAAIDAHETASGGSRELPQSGGAHPRARLGIE